MPYQKFSDCCFNSILHVIFFSARINVTFARNLSLNGKIVNLLMRKIPNNAMSTVLSTFAYVQNSTNVLQTKMLNLRLFLYSLDCIYSKKLTIWTYGNSVKQAPYKNGLVRLLSIQMHWHSPKVISLNQDIPSRHLLKNIYK